MISEYCFSKENTKKRRHSFNLRRLEMLKFIKDSLERRIASVDASINVLKNQIDRDESLDN